MKNIIFPLLRWLVVMNAISEFINGIDGGCNPSILTRVSIAFLAVGWIAGWYLEKRKNDILKEEIAQRDGHIKMLESQIRSLESSKSEKPADEISEIELVVLWQIQNYQKEHANLNYWEQHTSVEKLASLIQSSEADADEIIKELKSKNLLTDEAFRGSYIDGTRPINFSDPVVLTNKGRKILDKRIKFK